MFHLINIRIEKERKFAFGIGTDFKRMIAIFVVF